MDTKSKYNRSNSSLIEHAVFWLFMFLFIFDYHFELDNWREAAVTSFTELATYAVLVYINLQFCIPFILKKSKALYLLSLIGLVAAYISLVKLLGIEFDLYDSIGWRNIFSMMLNSILFLFISYLYWYFKQWNIERERQIILSGEKNEAELKFLKTQISPHFVFNTLNNIYSLAINNHTNTAPMVAKLSSILRYVLYEASNQKVALRSEWDMIKQFIELFLLKKPKSQNIDTYSEGGMEDFYIAPMMLVNLVENALKHSGLEYNESAWVNISLEMNPDGYILFSTENSVFAKTEKSNDGGIGLQNIKRQLEIGYPDNYKLNITELESSFQVKLQLQLTNNR